MFNVEDAILVTIIMSTVFFAAMLALRSHYRSMETELKSLQKNQGRRRGK